MKVLATIASGLKSQFSFLSASISVSVVCDLAYWVILACAAFIVHRLRLAVCVSVVADVCMISTHQTKINTFTDKDVEVSQNNRFANENAGKKIVVFWLGG
jgi:hypothetical protein